MMAPQVIALLDTSAAMENVILFNTLEIPFYIIVSTHHYKAEKRASPYSSIIILICCLPVEVPSCSHHQIFLHTFIKINPPFSVGFLLVSNVTCVFMSSWMSSHPMDFTIWTHAAGVGACFNSSNLDVAIV
jgi:hypothetical protein